MSGWRPAPAAQAITIGWMQTPERSLPLAGASNFRDLGGYVGSQGRSVRWRRLFRSDHLAGLSLADLAQLQALGITRACDFRGVQEREPQANALPGVAVHALSIEPTVVQDVQQLLAAGSVLTPPMMTGLMEQTYRDFVLGNTHRFAELFAHLLEDDTPLVFHCTAGKDRTGFAAAMILSALGVPRPVVMQDYLLTNAVYRHSRLKPAWASQEVFDVLWGVQPAFLEAAFAAIESQFGDLEAYLEKGLRLRRGERERLAQLYLER